jgi:EXS family
VPIAIYSGVAATLTFFFLFFLSIPGMLSIRYKSIGPDGLYHQENIIKEIPIFRSIFLLILLFFGTGVCIGYFREHRVNYVYIFGITPTNKLNQYQMYKMALFLYNMWIITAIHEVLAIKMFLDSRNIVHESWAPLFLISGMAVMLLNPLDMMQRPFRYELVYSFFHNLIAPFGLVRFKEFFLGDILTSMVRPLIDVYFIGCFFVEGQISRMTRGSASQLTRWCYSFL